MFSLRRKKPLLSVTMLVLMLVMLINALSYGIIIPLLYPYSARFGIGPGELSMLMASYSLFQFLATPLIGRMSDRYGRKPLLVLCLLGTAGSLALFAAAQTVVMLFVARILDGITGGNSSVAQAVIADTHKPSERAKAFGLLGAANGFGFLLGPALGGLLSRYSLTAPFWIAAGIALLGTLFAAVFLPETHHQRSKLSWNAEPLFDFAKLWRSLKAPTTGILLIIIFLASIALNSFILGFQSATVDVLKFTPFQVGMLFTIFGLVNVLMMGLGIRVLLKFFSTRRLLLASFAFSIVFVGLLGFASTQLQFLVLLFSFMFIPPAFPFMSSLLSAATKDEDQGGMMGISQAYTSMGQVIGPLLAGLIAQWYVPGAFWLSAGVWLVALVLARTLPKVKAKADL